MKGKFKINNFISIIILLINIKFLLEFILFFKDTYKVKSLFNTKSNIDK